MQSDLSSTVRLVVLAAVVSFLAGCQISNSVESISGSVSSPFKWSSSSSGGDDSAMYREDVERLTAAHVRAGGEAASLRRSLGDLARAQGVTDWASDAPTVSGLAAGLQAAGLDGAARDAYAARLLGEDADTLLQLAEHPAR
jgi:hypothetical protein